MFLSSTFLTQELDFLIALKIYNISLKVVAAVGEQFWSTDIRQPGVMVEQGLDIGNPAYGQLQKLHKVEARK